MNWKDERGAGRLGCLVTLLLAIIFGYLCFKIVPVYVDKMDFDEELARLASQAGSHRYSDEKIQNDIKQLARYKGFLLKDEAIKIERSGRVGGEIRISTRYEVPVSFPGYSHVFNFESRASSIVGTLR